MENETTKEQRETPKRPEVGIGVLLLDDAALAFERYRDSLGVSQRAPVASGLIVQALRSNGFLDQEAAAA